MAMTFGHTCPRKTIEGKEPRNKTKIITTSMCYDTESANAFQCEAEGGCNFVHKLAGTVGLSLMERKVNMHEKCWQVDV